MSVYISQLPEYSGSAADLRWFIMNNSGETTTFKYSGYTSPYKRVGTNNTNNIYDTNAMGGTYNVIIGGEINIINGGIYNAIIGGYDNDIINGGEYSFIANCYQASIGAGSNNNILGASGAIQGTSYNTGIYNAYNGNINGARYSVILGGFNTAITSWKSVNLGGEGLTNNTSQWSSLIGGANNTLTASEYGQIFGGFNNSITSSKKSSIINSDDCVISSSNNAIDRYNTIIGGYGNTITGGTFISMIGTSGRTGTASATTYVENLHVYRTPSTQVQPISSGTTFTCNLELGAKSQFYLTGTSTINITNVRDGASFMIKTQTDGNYNITWTATGYTFVFEGGLKDPGNNVTDIFVFEVFGSVIYGNRRHNYS